MTVKKNAPKFSHMVVSQLFKTVVNLNKAGHCSVELMGACISEQKSLMFFKVLINKAAWQNYIHFALREWSLVDHTL